MTRSGKMIIALAISIPLVLIGGGLAASADESPQQPDLPGGSVAVAALDTSIDDGVEADRVRMRQRAWEGLCLQNRLRACEQECLLAEDCEFRCPRASAGEEGAFEPSRTQAPRACFARATVPVEQETSPVDISCFRCDKEPLNEYPPQSPWYTGD